MDMLTAECGRRNRGLRARHVPDSRSRHHRIAEKRTGLFRRNPKRVGHAYWRCHRKRVGLTFLQFSRNEDSERLTKLILAETTTLGVRMRRESRAALARRHVSISTRWGEVRMKLANLNGSVSNYAPEYEDCRRIAKEQNVPLKTVMQE